MKPITIATAAALLLMSGSPVAAKDKAVSSLALQQVQSREFEATKHMAFAAVMTVLQDAGYRIGSADKDTGLITGIASTKTKTTWLPFVGFGKSKRTPVVSAYIEDRGPTIARIRLSFVMSKLKGNQFGNSADETPILDPVVYQGAFEKISKELFVRAAMIAPPPPPVVAPAQPSAVPAATPIAAMPAAPAPVPSSAPAAAPVQPPVPAFTPAPAAAVSPAPKSGGAVTCVTC